MLAIRQINIVEQNIAIRTLNHLKHVARCQYIFMIKTFTTIPLIRENFNNLFH
jgi:hypothetical protein